MTERRDWVVNISPSMNNKVKFANVNTLGAKGICDVRVMRKDGKKPVIYNILYIPCMKSKLLSIRKPIKKNYKVLIGDKTVRVLDSSGNLILKAIMS